MKILQITDSHIRKDPAALVYGINPRDKFQIIVNFISASNLEFDTFLLTGDIADDGSQEAYDFIAKHLTQFNKKVYYINGNHDNKETMINTFSQFSSFEYLSTLSFANYALIGIDSCVPDKDYGFLSDTTLQNIKDNIIRFSLDNKKCVLVLHHHPVLVNTPLIDDCPLINGNKFMQIVNNYKNVLLIISGHVHNDYKIKINENCIFEASLSTFMQFNYGGKTELDMSSKPFGFKLFEFSNNSYNSKTITIN